MSEKAECGDPFGQAFAEARAAAARGEVPVGAAVLRAGRVLASAGNRTIEHRDPTAHAEVLAIRAACRVLGSERLVDCDLYVTLEPCALCAAAISFARLRRVYYAAPDPKGGGVDHGPRFFAQPTCHHAPEVYGGIRETEASALLRDFFKERRSPSRRIVARPALKEETMLSHVHIGIRDFDIAFRFYSAMLAELSVELRFCDSAIGWAGWHAPESSRPLLLIGRPFDGAAATPGNGQMTALLAPSRDAVDRAHAAALAAGGTDEGAPGLRPHYHPDYYGAYVRDPDGNKLCVCCHAAPLT